MIKKRGKKPQRTAFKHKNLWLSLSLYTILLEENKIGQLLQ